MAKAAPLFVFAMCLVKRKDEQRLPKTLFRPFENGTPRAARAGSRALFLGAKPGFRPPEDFVAQALPGSGIPRRLPRPPARRLLRPARAEGRRLRLALVLAGRHRGENELRLAEAIGRVTPDGLIVMAGDNARTASPACASGSTRCLPLGGHLSKHHGVVFWLQRSPEADAFAATTKDWHGNWPLIERRFRTAPGMFSYDRVDQGSRILAEALPADLAGRAADFCAGWGYLAAELAVRCPNVYVDRPLRGRLRFAGSREGQSGHGPIGFDPVLLARPAHRTRRNPLRRDRHEPAVPPGPGSGAGDRQQADRGRGKGAEESRKTVPRRQQGLALREGARDFVRRISPNRRRQRLQGIRAPPAEPAQCTVAATFGVVSAGTVAPWSIFSGAGLPNR